jgi:type III secretion protein J
MPSSAAVFIKHRRQLSLEEIVPQIKRLVSNSIPGLNAEKVSVIMVPAVSVRRTMEPGHASGMAASVWGIELAPGSATSARGLLTGMLAMLMAAIGAVAFLAWKLWGADLQWRLPLLGSRRRQHTSGES